MGARSAGPWTSVVEVEGEPAPELFIVPVDRWAARLDLTISEQDLGHRRARQGEHDRLGPIWALHATLPRVLLPLDLDLPSRRVSIPNASQLADCALVSEPRDLAGLEALPDTKGRIRGPQKAAIQKDLDRLRDTRGDVARYLVVLSPGTKIAVERQLGTATHYPTVQVINALDVGFVETTADE